MREELIIKGRQNINKKEVKIIEGGFGNNQKCILVSDIAIQHDISNSNDINKLINKNIHRFNNNDIIDLLNDQQSFREFAKENGLIKSNRTKNLYLLSERGYTKLVAMLDNTNERKWEVMDRLIDEYFSMRKIVNSDEELKKQLLLQLYNGGVDSIEAHKKLAEIEVHKAKKEVVGKLQDRVNFAEIMTNENNVYDVGTVSKALGIKGMGRNKLFEFLREEKILMYNNEPYQNHTDKFKVIMTTNKKSGHMSSKTLVNGKGVKLIYKRLVKKGYIIRKTREEILRELDNQDLAA